MLLRISVERLGEIIALGQAGEHAEGMLDIQPAGAPDMVVLAETRGRVDGVEVLGGMALADDRDAYCAPLFKGLPRVPPTTPDMSTRPRAYGKWCSGNLSYRHLPSDVLISDIAIATKAGRGESLWGRRSVRWRDRQSTVKA
ncbi:hypothetical protein [Rhizorhabdus sp. FW153]|uniref:hypothetical protein n=1 Tax=Rhizorhabdus sp. FW153 TaxID=3400216 RepID=UPI003CF09ADC